MANCNRSCSGCSSGSNTTRRGSCGCNHGCGCSHHSHGHCHHCGCHRCRCNANVNCNATRSNGCSACNGCTSCNGCTTCSNCGNCSSCNHSRNTGCGCQRSYGCLNAIPSSNSCPGNWNWRTACLGYDPLNICQNYEHFPFYSGPCGTVCPIRICNPCDPQCVDDCGDCCDECDACDECDECHCSGAASLAVFTACAPMDVAPGCCVPLVPSGSCDAFIAEPGGIRILRAGTYLVTYTAHIPCYQHFSSQLYLTLDGAAISASQQDVSALSDGTSTGSTAQVVVHAQAGSLLSLQSSSAFHLASASSTANVFTLSIMGVG